MSKTSFFSYDIDTGDVVAKTDIQNDGTVNRYTYTVPDNIKEGHGDTWYGSVTDFMNDNPIDSRDKNDPRSIGRDWKGNGYTFDVLNISNESNLDNVVYTKTLKKF